MLDGENLAQRTCRVALEADGSPVVLMLGARAEEVLQAGTPSGVRVHVHSGWAEGMGGTIAAGMDGLTTDPLDAVMLLLADQPAIDASCLRRLVLAYERGASIVISDSGRSWGPPALFARRHFRALRALKGDQGAKAIVQENPTDRAVLAMPEAAWDVDEPDRWQAFLVSRGMGWGNRPCESMGVEP